MNEGLFRHRLINTFRYNPGYMIAYYDVTSTSSKTKLLGDSFNNKRITTMYIDDVEVDVTSSYQFDTTGEHVVKLHLSPQTRRLNHMFDSVTTLKTLDVTNLNVDSIVSALRMFNKASSLENIIGFENLNFVNLENMDNMFSQCSNLTSLDVICFQNSPITSCTETFFSSDLFIQNLHKMNLTNVKSFNNTFCSIQNEEISGFEKPPIRVVSCTFLFQHCKAKRIDLSNWGLVHDQNVNLSSVFLNCTNLESITLPLHIKTAVIDRLFEKCTNLSTIPEFFFNLDLSNRLRMDATFRDCTSLINVDLSSFNVHSDVEYVISGLFRGCSNLETVLLPHGRLLANNYSEGYVFEKCAKLKNLDLSNNTFSIYLLNNCFVECGALENIVWGATDYLTIGSTSSVSIGYCFYKCTSLKTLNLSTWDVHLVENMNYLFADCSSLESINLEGWDTSNVININWIFGGVDLTNSYITSLDLTHLNLENVISALCPFTLFENLTVLKVQTVLNKDLFVAGFVLPNTSGTFYYDTLLSDCYEIISKLPTSWNIVSTSQITNCTSLSITADDVSGNEYTTVLYYEAIVNGKYENGTSFTGVTITGHRESDPFGKNMSETESIIKTISFALFGKSAITTITQGPLISNSIFCIYHIYYKNASLFTYSCKQFFDYMIVDGVQTDISTNFKFDTRGKHKVWLHLSENGITNTPRCFIGTDLYKCDLSEVDLSHLSYSTYNGFTYCLFSGCNYLTYVVFPDSIKYLDKAFYNAPSLHTIVLRNPDKPGSTTDMFGIDVSPQTYAGKYNKGSRINKLYIPINNMQTWNESILLNTYDFTVKHIFEPSECTSLSITAENVSGIWPYTTIHYEAVTKGFDIIDGYVENVVITGTAISDSFGQNTSETESVVKEVSFTYMGVTATTTIIQGVYKQREVILNDQWRLSTNVANPNTSSFDGVYESFSNYNVAKGMATMYIDIDGYTNFKLYIRSYANAYYDYVMVSHLDKEITTETNNTNTSVVKSHTRGAQSSGTDISNYKLVKFTEIEPGPHRITIVYRKSGSIHQGDDRGYVLIPKNQ